jgi:hypothetical protein
LWFPVPDKNAAIRGDLVVKNKIPVGMFQGKRMLPARMPRSPVDSSHPAAGKERHNRQPNLLFRAKVTAIIDDSGKTDPGCRLVRRGSSRIPIICHRDHFDRDRREWPGDDAARFAAGCNREPGFLCPKTLGPQ